MLNPTPPPPPQVCFQVWLASSLMADSLAVACQTMLAKSLAVKDTSSARQVGCEAVCATASECGCDHQVPVDFGAPKPVSRAYNCAWACDGLCAVWMRAQQHPGASQEQQLHRMGGRNCRQPKTSSRCADPLSWQCLHLAHPPTPELQIKPTPLSVLLQHRLSAAV